MRSFSGYLLSTPEAPKYLASLPEAKPADNSQWLARSSCVVLKWNICSDSGTA